MSEPGSAPEEVSGPIHLGDADFDEYYQDAEMDGFEVRDTTGFIDNVPGIPNNVQGGDSNAQRYDKAAIQSVVKEAVQNCLVPMLDEIKETQHTSKSGYGGESPQHKPLIGDQRYGYQSQYDKTPERKGYQRDESDFYSKEIPGFYENVGSYNNHYSRANDKLPGWAGLKGAKLGVEMVGKAGMILTHISGMAPQAIGRTRM